jgi:hypothetical protein
VLLLQELQSQAGRWLGALGARLQGLPAGTAGTLLQQCWLQCWLQAALASCCTRGASLWPCLCLLLLLLLLLLVGAHGRLPQKLCC